METDDVTPPHALYQRAQVWQGARRCRGTIAVPIGEFGRRQAHELRMLLGEYPVQSSVRSRRGEEGHRGSAPWRQQSTGGTSGGACVRHRFTPRRVWGRSDGRRLVPRSAVVESDDRRRFAAISRPLQVPDYRDVRVLLRALGPDCEQRTVSAVAAILAARTSP
jgi:hypothetical protein